jgi:hypothetical protein
MRSASPGNSPARRRHADVRTTEIYTQLARAMRGEITSPLDDLNL